LLAHDQEYVPAQGWTQRPAEQTCPAPHDVPQAPQFALFARRLRHTPPQRVNPRSQVVAHAPPALQIAISFAGGEGQAVQAGPQCVGSALVKQAVPHA
jgi:hypothetical protein